MGIWERVHWRQKVIVIVNGLSGLIAASETAREQGRRWWTEFFHGPEAFHLAAIVVSPPKVYTQHNSGEPPHDSDGDADAGCYGFAADAAEASTGASSGMIGRSCGWE